MTFLSISDREISIKESTKVFLNSSTNARYSYMRESIPSNDPINCNFVDDVWRLDKKKNWVWKRSDSFANGYCGLSEFYKVLSLHIINV